MSDSHWCSFMDFKYDYKEEKGTLIETYNGRTIVPRIRVFSKYTSDYTALLIKKGILTQGKIAFLNECFSANAVIHEVLVDPEATKHMKFHNDNAMFAFSFCPRLQRVTGLPAASYMYGFRDCPVLEAVSFNCTDDSSLDLSYAFCNCPSLKRVYNVPRNAKGLDTAFYGLSQKVEVTYV